MKRLAILGASGHGKVIADTALLSGWNEVVFFDDAWPNLNMNGPWPVVGDSHVLMTCHSDYDGVAVGIGDNSIRAAKQMQLAATGVDLVNVIHPSAVVSPLAIVERGSVIFANAVVNACAILGIGSIVNTGAVVEHDCVVGEFCHISPNAVLAGGVKLDARVWVGACSSVRQLVRISEDTVVGMGSVVTKNIPSKTTVIGNPAKVLASSKR